MTEAAAVRLALAIACGAVSGLAIGLVYFAVLRLAGSRLCKRGARAGSVVPDRLAARRGRRGFLVARAMECGSGDCRIARLHAGTPAGALSPPDRIEHARQPAADRDPVLLGARSHKRGRRHHVGDHGPARWGVVDGIAQGNRQRRPIADRARGSAQIITTQVGEIMGRNSAQFVPLIGTLFLFLVLCQPVGGLPRGAGAHRLLSRRRPRWR